MKLCKMIFFSFYYDFFMLQCIKRGNYMDTLSNNVDKLNIHFKSNDITFNFRVGVMIEYKDKVLLETNGKFWNFIGGRVHFGDSTIEAINREVEEELGITLKNLKLINVSELFFDWQGNSVHELFFIYKTTLDDSYDIVKNDTIKCLDTNDNFKWHKKSDVKNLVCKPAVIYDLVKSDCSYVTHYVEK